MITEQPITDYKVVITLSGQELERDIKDLLHKGYQPFGAPHMTSSSDGLLSWTYFHQVMVKREKPTERQIVEMLGPENIFSNSK